MRVVVTGLVATYPMGGVAWDYLQYVLGFRALGADVLYLEDTGQWGYDPDAQTFTPDLEGGARFLGAALARLDPALASCWAVRDVEGRWHGRDAAAVAAACNGADLFLNVSGACWLREPYRRARVVAYLDSDPCYSQAKLAAMDAGIADDRTARSATMIRGHGVFFTLGEHIGAPDCTIPSGGLTWRPTRQPVWLPAWPVTPAPAAAPFTTVLSWAINPTPPSVDGRVYGGKDVELRRLIDLPSRAPAPLELAVSGEAPRERLARAGWRVRDARPVSATLDAYRDYVQASRGELSVAKNAYVATRSGWFSTRSAVYLASGRPCVLQDTGFPAHVPTGPGLHAFDDVAGAVRGLDAVLAAPARAAEHARAVAEEHFRAETVCARLFRDAGC